MLKQQQLHTHFEEKAEDDTELKMQDNIELKMQKEF